ncbi:sugar ABC transporter permease, partial [Streptomyces sp. NPDC048506]
MPTHTTEPLREAGAAAAAPGRRPTGLARHTRKATDWARRAPLLPALVFLVVVTQLPFVATVVISFLRW